jgi:hypothetical protein
LHIGDESKISVENSENENHPPDFNLGIEELVSVLMNEADNSEEPSYRKKLEEISGWVSMVNQDVEGESLTSQQLNTIFHAVKPLTQVESDEIQLTGLDHMDSDSESDVSSEGFSAELIIGTNTEALNSPNPVEENILEALEIQSPFENTFGVASLSELWDANFDEEVRGSSLNGKAINTMVETITIDDSGHTGEGILPDALESVNKIHPHHDHVVQLSEISSHSKKEPALFIDVSPSLTSPLQGAFSPGFLEKNQDIVVVNDDAPLPLTEEEAVANPIKVRCRLFSV